MVLKTFIISMAIVFSFSAKAPSLYSLTKKRADKTMDKHWQGEEYALTQIDLASVSSAEIYAVKQGNSMAVAYVMFAKAMGKVDSFIYMIIFKPDGAIELVSVLLYKENYGGEIGSKRFLKQFEGKSNGLNMEYNKDIDGISGATISVQAITRSIKENSANFSNLIKQLQ